jgi:aspartate aminotransferase
MSITYAQRLNQLSSESAFRVLARARALEAEGRDIVHLEIGDPDFATSEHVIEAACRALWDGATHYAPPPGIPALREAIAEQIGERRHLSISPEQVVVTPGAKPALFFALLALAEPGTEVLYPDPGFPIYRSVIGFCGADPVAYPLREELRFSFRLEDVRARITPRTRAIILNSPHNPTGGVIPREDLAALADLCVAHEIVAISDEIYEFMDYDGTFASIAEMPGMSPAERTVIVHGFSKTHAMTGWRLGYGVMPAPMADKMALLMVNSNSCTATATQMAGVAALRGPWEPVQAMLDAFAERRQVLVEGLNAIPKLRCAMPGGAFYAFPNIRGTGMASAELETYLLEEGGVATLAGTGFGEEGEGYLRLSYANSVERLRIALERIESALQRLPG